MTTADFIAKTYNTTSTRERRCSSVFTDYDGNVYSYGYHYPLAFNINGLDFVNTRGYSSTTAKHIAWAKAALNYEHIPVELDRADAQVISSKWSTNGQKLDVIRAALNRQYEELRKQQDAKKRKDTAVYADLERQLEVVRAAAEKVGK